MERGLRVPRMRDPCCANKVCGIARDLPLCFSGVTCYSVLCARETTVESRYLGLNSQIEPQSYHRTPCFRA